jgi:3',5'-cyclic AMP phosphodiesterase CpdA
VPSRILLLAAIVLSINCSSDPPPRVIVISDTHIIGPQYTEPHESSPADNESIFLTPARLRALRDQVNAMRPLPAAVFVAGDVIHAAHHSKDLAWYDANRNAYTEAKEIFDSFAMPVHVVMGNHDYEMGCGDETYPKALSEELFRHFFGVEPYYAVEVGGVRFYMLNGQQGRTWDPAGLQCNTEFASYGAAQLAWLDKELADGKPAVVMSHYMGLLWEGDENPAVPAQKDLKTVLDAHDNVRIYFGGHSHRWVDLSDFYRYESYVLGPARYDSDDFWTLELGDPIHIIDKDKAVWSTTCASTYRYDDDRPAPVADAPETGTCVGGINN